MTRSPQVLRVRSLHGVEIPLILFNSKANSAATLNALAKHPALRPEEVLQHQALKIDPQNLLPAKAPAGKDPSHEWGVSGHGDVYAALVGSGKLDELLRRGIKFLFISSANNVGATFDASLLSWFASKRVPFAMEVVQRAEADKAGGHLALRARSQSLVLRETAMCANEDEGAFCNVSKHKFFNTNNCWVDLAQLKTEATRNGGALPLRVHLPYMDRARAHLP